MEICRVYFWTLNHARPLHWSLASWRDISGRVTHEITGRAPATPAEGYLVFFFFVFFCCFVKHAASPGFKNLTRVTSTEILLRCSRVTVHQVRGARCSPRGGRTLSRAGRNKVGARRRARAARKKKKKNSTRLRPTIGLRWFDFSRIDRDCTWKTERSRAVTLQQRGKINWGATVRARSY